MDTAEKYRGDEFFVVMAGERGPDWYVEHMESQFDAVDVLPANDHHALDPDIPVDGWVTFYDPDLLETGEPFKHGTFPFRSVDTDDQWFVHPDAQKGRRRPIWKWENPEEDPTEHLTLSPSIGMGMTEPSEDPDFHCFIQDGEIKWL